MRESKSPVDADKVGMGKVRLQQGQEIGKNISIRGIEDYSIGANMVGMGIGRVQHGQQAGKKVTL
jgi:hypothetical protein